MALGTLEKDSPFKEKGKKAKHFVQGFVLVLSWDTLH